MVGMGPLCKQEHTCPSHSKPCSPIPYSINLQHLLPSKAKLATDPMPFQLLLLTSETSQDWSLCSLNPCLPSWCPQTLVVSIGRVDSDKENRLVDSGQVGGAMTVGIRQDSGILTNHSGVPLPAPPHPRATQS